MDNNLSPEELQELEMIVGSSARLRRLLEKFIVFSKHDPTISLDVQRADDELQEAVRGFLTTPTISNPYPWLPRMNQWLEEQGLNGNYRRATLRGMRDALLERRVPLNEIHPRKWLKEEGGVIKLEHIASRKTKTYRRLLELREKVPDAAYDQLDLLFK